MNSKNTDILWNILQDLIDAGGQGRASALKEMHSHCESISRMTGIQVSEVSEWVASKVPVPKRPYGAIAGKQLREWILGRGPRPSWVPDFAVGRLPGDIL